MLKSSVDLSMRLDSFHKERIYLKIVFDVDMCIANSLFICQPMVNPLEPKKSDLEHVKFITHVKFNIGGTQTSLVQYQNHQYIPCIRKSYIVVFLG